MTGCIPDGLRGVSENDFAELGLPFCAVDDSVSCAAGGAVADASNNPGLVSDCDTLLAARDTLAGSAALNWSAGTPIDQWVGITAAGSPLRVTGLDLVAKGLTGEIPAALGNLANLESLALGRNQLTGEIPAELGRLSNLKVLYISFNDLGGTIPDELSSLANLEQLFLQETKLTGPIPAWLGGLSNLEYLVLPVNELNGPIPTELGSLSNLELLLLNQNQLTGPIPPELGNLASLEWLYLSENEFTGSIPASLGSLANLKRLYVSENRLTGPIPTELGGLAKLEHLFLSENQLTGCIPGEFRGVAENDLGDVNLPFCDVLLSGLSVGPGSLVPQFDPYRTDYSASVGLAPVTVTLDPTNDHNANFQFLDENDLEVADADNTLEGFQVEFGAGVPAIKIRVVLTGQSGDPHLHRHGPG